jgi:hypothetical protein
MRRNVFQARRSIFKARRNVLPLRGKKISKKSD